MHARDMSQEIQDGPAPSASKAVLLPSLALGTSRDEAASPIVARSNGTFSSLRHRNYRLYFIGQFVSISGSWLQTTALAWLAFERTKLSTWAAAISAAQILPTFLLGAWGGTLADRWPKRRLIFGTQAASLVLAVVLAGLVVVELDSPWILLAVATLCGIVNAIDVPARLAFVVEMVGKEDLVNAVALNSLLFNAARTLGPALGAALLPTLGPALCFLVNGLSFVAVLAALAAMDGTQLSRPPPAIIKTSLSAGVAYLRRHWRLLGLVLLSGAMSFFGWPILTLLPALAKQVGGGAQDYGTFVSAIGLGAMVASLLVATCGSATRRRFLIGLGAALQVIGLGLLCICTTAPAAFICCTVVGCGLILFFATSQAVTQLSSGDHNRGVIMGVWSMVLSAAHPAGTMLAGIAADAIGLPIVLLIQALGVACAGAAVVMVLRHPATTTREA
jgi:predicted MFS family arabinose efflux permease